jgi:hypothetical protein
VLFDFHAESRGPDPLAIMPQLFSKQWRPPGSLYSPDLFLFFSYDKLC